MFDMIIVTLVIPSWPCTDSLQGKMAGSSRSALKEGKTAMLQNTDLDEEQTSCFSLHSPRFCKKILTNSKHGIFNVPRHLLLNDLLNVLVGALDEFLEHCGEKTRN